MKHTRAQPAMFLAHCEKLQFVSIYQTHQDTPKSRKQHHCIVLSNPEEVRALIGWLDGALHRAWATTADLEDWER